MPNSDDTLYRVFAALNVELDRDRDNEAASAKIARLSGLLRRHREHFLSECLTMGFDEGEAAVMLADLEADTEAG